MNFSANWIYLLGFELAIGLAVVCIVFVGHIRRQRKLITALEEKIVDQRDAMRTTRATFDALKSELQGLRGRGESSYSDVLQEQLDVTRNRHAALSPDRDIVLDITVDTPPQRQILAMRHAFLIAEQEAALAADNKGLDWDVLESKLAQILDFYRQMPAMDLDIDETGPTDEPLDIGDDDQQRHIANLEKYRDLYFDVERKWREARADAERYHRELAVMGESLGASAEFDALLQRYVDVYAGVDGVMDGVGSEPAAGDFDVRPSVGKVVIANQEEIQRLRNMAVDQHKIIVELKRKLEGADSPEAQASHFEELHEQLDRHQRYVQEADSCIQQLESDISHLLAENQQLKSQQESGAPAAAAGDSGELELLRGLVTSFTDQSRGMLGAIAVLEEDNRKLLEKPEASGGDSEELRSRLGQTQQELLKLQTQYLELEERYLELKMQTN